MVSQEDINFLKEKLSRQMPLSSEVHQGCLQLPFSFFIIGKMTFLNLWRDRWPRNTTATTCLICFMTSVRPEENNGR